MSLFLQVVLTWQFFSLVLAVAAITSLIVFIIKKMKKHPNVLLGLSGLIQSSSGVFGLLTLAAITLVTLKRPTVGGVAFAAFVGVVPAILTIAEHRETLVGISQVAPPIEVVPNPMTTVAAPLASNLPVRGSM